MKGLEGKTAIVSGGATLIGARCAAALAGYGAHVVIADINVADGVPAAQDIGPNATFVKTDITRDEDIAALIEKTVSLHRRLDFIVNVACTYLANGAETARADWLTAFDVNIVGSVMLMQAARPHLKKNRGAIVNFSSIPARVAQAGRWVYPVSKAAILQLTRNQALDLAPDGIRVNSISSGWTSSSTLKQLTHDDRGKSDRVAAPFHLLRRAGDPSEIAEAVAFLLSDAASFITGSDVKVDGGYTTKGTERADRAITLLAQ